MPSNICFPVVEVIVPVVVFAVLKQGGVVLRKVVGGKKEVGEVVGKGGQLKKWGLSFRVVW